MGRLAEKAIAALAAMTEEERDALIQKCIESTRPTQAEIDSGYFLYLGQPLTVAFSLRYQPDKKHRRKVKNRYI